jgi:drug/metabolite transporter (DMT)-like permease
LRGADLSLFPFSSGRAFCRFLRENTYIIVIVAVYSIFSTTEVIFTKCMNNTFGLSLPIFTSLLLSAYWPIQTVYHGVLVRSKKHGALLPWHLRGPSLIVIGVSSCLITYFRAVGLTNLTGFFFVICSSSDVMWQVLLSKLFFREVLLAPHYASIFLCVCSISLTAFGNYLQSKSEVESGDDDDAGQATYSTMQWGVIASLSSAFLSALNAAASQFVFKRLGIKQGKSSLLSVSEVSLFNAVIPCFLLLVFAVAVPNIEVDSWSASFASVDAGGRLPLFVTICLGLSLGKMFDRLCKFLCISLTSSLHFVVADTLRRGGTALVSSAIFNEKTDWYSYVGLVLMIGSLFMYVRGNKEKDALERKKEEEKSKAEWEKAAVDIADNNNVKRG